MIGKSCTMDSITGPKLRSISDGQWHPSVRMQDGQHVRIDEAPRTRSHVPERSQLSIARTEDKPISHLTKRSV